MHSDIEMLENVGISRNIPMCYEFCLWASNVLMDQNVIWNTTTVPWRPTGATMSVNWTLMQPCPNSEDSSMLIYCGTEISILHSYKFLFYSTQDDPYIRTIMPFVSNMRQANVWSTNLLSWIEKVLHGMTDGSTATSN